MQRVFRATRTNLHEKYDYPTFQTALASARGRLAPGRALGLPKYSARLRPAQSLARYACQGFRCERLERTPALRESRALSLVDIRSHAWRAVMS